MCTCAKANVKPTKFPMVLRAVIVCVLRINVTQSKHFYTMSSLSSSTSQIFSLFRFRFATRVRLIIFLFLLINIFSIISFPLPFIFGLRWLYCRRLFSMGIGNRVFDCYSTSSRIQLTYLALNFFDASVLYMYPICDRRKIDSWSVDESNKQICSTNKAYFADKNSSIRHCSSICRRIVGHCNLERVRVRIVMLLLSKRWPIQLIYSNRMYDSRLFSLLSARTSY